jgi:hypothetical protein
VPQPFCAKPHICPAVEHGSGSGVQPHTFGVPPPPQVSNPVQVPQPSMLPQPSGIVPQFFPCAAHVVGVHTVVVVVDVVVVVVVRISGAHTIFGALGVTVRAPNWSCHWSAATPTFGHLTL